MHLHLALIAAAALLVAADETKKDEERIQGTWSVITLVAEGEEYPTEKANMMTVAFKGDTMELLGGKEEKYTFKLDSTKKPKAMDIAGKRDPDGIPAIYELEGDSLKICWNKSNKVKGRPDKFAPTADNHWSMMTLKRKGK
jgi:uncharacterized protein (TIGR03067 family)